MLLPAARLIHLLSVAICLVVIASFGLFALNQTSSASAHQQRVLNESQPQPQGTPAPARSDQPSSARKAIDEASDFFTSPFAGIVKASDSEWAKRGARLLLALAVYGFGLGYLARVLRVRV